MAMAMAATDEWLKKKKRMEDGRVGIGMLVVQMIATGLQLLSRVILNQGSFVFAYMFYRHLVGALCVAPFALFFERFIYIPPYPSIFTLCTQLIS